MEGRPALRVRMRCVLATARAPQFSLKRGEPRVHSKTRHAFPRPTDPACAACAIFPALDKSVVRQTLIDCEGDVDRTIPLLFERDAAQRRASHAQDKIRLMEEAFAGLPPQLIADIVKKNDGDISASSAELLRIMQERQEQEELALVQARKEASRQKHAHSRAARQRFVEHCLNTFDCLAREEIMAVLSTAGTDDADVSSAVAKLTELANERKARNLAAMYANVAPEEVTRVLHACAFDMQAACEMLSFRVVPSATAVDPKDQLDRTIVDAMRALKDEAPADDATTAALQDLVRHAVGPTETAAPVPEAPLVPADASSLPAGLEVELLVERTTFSTGAACQVRVQASGGAVSSYDWVSLQLCDSDVAITWQWFQPTLSFSLPAHGLYQLHYWRKVDGVPRRLASSAILLCGPQVQLAVQRESDTWIVGWAAAHDAEPVSSSAWVGLYDVTCRDHRQYLAFNYISLTSRSLAFKAPRTNGRYEFRFFASRFGRVVSSQELVVAHVDAVVTTHTDAPAMRVHTTVASVEPSHCWVGIFHANEERPRWYRRYSWISSATQQFDFKTPIHTGTYEARIYTSSNVVLARSPHFTIA